MLVAHIWISLADSVEISPAPPPISAKKPFSFSDIGNSLGRNYLILREMFCRYLCSRELWVFLEWKLSR
jgi:hypothetical protein